MFVGLRTAREMRAVSVWDQGHTLHISVKKGLEHSHPLPALLAHPTHTQGGDNHELMAMKQGLLPVWSSLECNRLFWTSDAKNKARISNSRAREHLTMLVGLVKRVTKKQESKKALCQRMFKVYRSSRADWTNMAREIPRSDQRHTKQAGHI